MSSGAGIAPTEDPFGGRAFISPAKIRVLLTPSGPNVSPADFERWAAVVRSFESIRLADLPVSTNGRPGPAVGSALHRFGEVHLSFVTSYDPSHSFLAPFAMHRQVLGVLALGSLEEGKGKDYEKVPGALRELHPNAIVHRAFLFDTKAGKEGDKGHSRQSSVKDPIESARNSSADHERTASGSGSGEGSGDSSFSSPSTDTMAGFADTANSGLVIFPAVRRDGKDVRFYLRTLLRDFLGTLLDGLWDVVAALEGKSLETPRETLDGSLVTSSSSSAGTSSASSTSSQSTSLATSPSSSSSSAASRASSFFSSFGSSSTSSSSPVGGGTLPDALSHGSANGNSKSAVSQSSAARSSKVKRSSSLVGAGPTGAGRYAKVRADYALLSGDLWGALGGYDTCMSWLGKERALAGGQDAVWYASALEGWAVARCLVFRMSGLEEKGPNLSLPTGGAKERDKSAKAAVPESPFAKLEWADVAEAYSLALDIYSKTLAPPRYLAESARSVNSETPRDYTHPLIHASACIAYSRLLLAVWASSGWNAECFDQLIYGGVPPSLVEDARPGPAMYAALSKASVVQRHEIAAPASLALSHSVSALKPPDQIAILCSLANVFGCIGFLRREAYLLRQLQAAVVSLLARALLLHPREPRTLSMALSQIVGSEHRALGGAGTMISQTLTSGLGEGADAVLILALQICETYGVNVDVEPLKGVPPNHILSKAARTGKTTARGEPLLPRRAKDTATASARQYASEADHETGGSTGADEPIFGWLDLQVALLKDTICVAEMLQDHVGMAFFAAILLRDYHEVLSGDEQRSLMRGLARCVTTARWGDARDLEVLYWGPPEPLYTVEGTGPGELGIPVERPGKELREADEAEKAGTSASTSTIAGLNNPFFWNPTSRSGTAGSSTKNKSKDSLLLMQGEEAVFHITLQNPFKTTLELTNVKLSTRGAPFEAHALPQVLLPAQSYTTVRLTGVCSVQGPGSEAGSDRLTVQGCFLTLSGCTEREFRVHTYDEAAHKVKEASEAAADDRRSRLKVSGLDARPAFVAQRRALEGHAERTGSTGAKKAGATPQLPQGGFLTCRVVPSQPLLQVDAPSSLTHGRLTVLEGQTIRLRLRLTNLSDLPVDYLRFTLQDDATTSILAALREGDVLPSDAYHLERQLSERPVLSLPQGFKPRGITIPPGRSVVVSLQLRGTLDCTRGSVSVDYAYVNAPGRGGLVTEERRDFWTRSARLDFGVDVRPVLECGGWRVERMDRRNAESVLRGVKDGEEQGEVNRYMVDEKKGSDEENDLISLVSLDVRNVHHREVRVSLDVTEDVEEASLATTSSGSADSYPRKLTISHLIPSDRTVPIFFTLPQLPLSAEELSNKEIPSSSLASMSASTAQQRQFVLSRFKLDPAEVEGSRLRFWIGEELRRRLAGSRWSEVDDYSGRRRIASSSSGSIAKQQGDWSNALAEACQDLDEGLCKRLLRREVELSLDVLDPTGSALQLVEPEQFVSLRLRVRNATARVSSHEGGRSLRLTYRLVPLPGSALSSSSRSNASAATPNTPAAGTTGPLLAAGAHSTDSVLSQVLVTDGALSGAMLGREDDVEVTLASSWPLLSPGKEASVQTGLLFLGEGLFRFVGVVEEADADEDDEEGLTVAGKKVGPQSMRKAHARAEVSIDVRVVRSGNGRAVGR
ncbi:hypothetical protein BDZ90DRAFT_231881 [Jaminaea rosea]|uniref:Trs120-domain-containing protein n=1 Tax=Jaminaea rosea TaxID=1569628 RepID=A0A316UYA7_9BASI|nr:hypothetical protein BDZ90DRAFT_231881 [Jaminaea rosea]PWN28125.1 hypothetical protein BDZ90DRAFT_231881 [Jaminaea rosea]